MKRISAERKEAVIKKMLPPLSMSVNELMEIEVKKKPQGCVVVRENLPPGTSQAVVCRDNHFKGPIVNKWEIEIDN